MRFLTPSLFFATALFLWFYNGRGGDDVLAFSFVPMFWPEAAGDPQRLSLGTIGIVVALGTIFLARDVALFLRARRQRAEHGGSRAEHGG